MLVNPIQEQRKAAKKYTIGYFSTNSEFGKTLENSLMTGNTHFRFIDLNDLPDETLKLYLSVLDEAVFDTQIPKNIADVLSVLKLFIRVIAPHDIEKISNAIQERSNLVLELKKEKNFEHEKDLKFIMQIISILENKDPYTKDHSARVVKYALAIGEEFFAKQYDHLYPKAKKQDSEQYKQMKQEYIAQKMNLTMLAAWAHDIGKNSIAQSLLSKDSVLTEEEHDLIKMHADFGAEMIRKILENEELAEIIETHHERIDGFGYHHLTEFPDIAKIIAIADSFDAMTTTRNYTTKLEEFPEKLKLKTVKEAINDLQVASHLHFDIEENRMSQQLDTELTDILIQKIKKDLQFLKDGKTSDVVLLTGGLDEHGYLKAGFWNDKTQEYIHARQSPNLLS